MDSVLKAASSVRSFLLGWFLPSLASASLVVFVILPAVAPQLKIAKVLQTLDWLQLSAVVAGATLAESVLLVVLQRPMYRVLTGHYFSPKKLVDGQVRRKKELKSRYDVARDGQNQVDMNKLLEGIRRFPVEENEIKATMLGNVLGSAETYGWDRYRLDIVSLWYQLLAVVPKDLRDDEDRARANLDFNVCAAYLSVAVSVISIIAMLAARTLVPGLVIMAIALVGLSWIFYRGSVFAAQEWSRTIEAITDLGRPQLADQLGLKMPASLESERDMWRAVGQLLKYPYTSNRSTSLQPFRKR